MNLDLRTERQKERDLSDIRIAAIYEEAKKSYPDANITGLIRAMAHEGSAGFGIGGIRNALVRRGILER